MVVTDDVSKEEVSSLNEPLSKKFFYVDDTSSVIQCLTCPFLLIALSPLEIHKSTVVLMELASNSDVTVDLILGPLDGSLVGPEMGAVVRVSVGYLVGRPSISSFVILPNKSAPSPSYAILAHHHGRSSSCYSYPYD